jgi:hypothetical protein
MNIPTSPSGNFYFTTKDFLLCVMHFQIMITYMNGIACYFFS